MDLDLLKSEIATYDRERQRLADKAEGGWVVIAGTNVLAIMGDYEDAMAFGYKAVGLKPFLVKQIARVEPEVVV